MCVKTLNDIHLETEGVEHYKNLYDYLNKNNLFDR